MAAISSTLRYLDAQLASVVCLRPVSPLTKYATGRACMTGILVIVPPKRTVRNNCMAALCSVAPWISSPTTSSGRNPDISLRAITLSYGMYASPM
jgi:hypothetical protein